MKNAEARRDRTKGYLLRFPTPVSAGSGSRVSLIPHNLPPQPGLLPGTTMRDRNANAHCRTNWVGTPSDAYTIREWRIDRKRPSQTECRIGRYAARPIEYFLDACLRHARVCRQRASRDAHRIEKVIAQHFANCHERYFRVAMLCGKSCERTTRAGSGSN